MISSHAALLLIDCQNDFCRAGSLAVPDADSIMPIANTLQPLFQHVIATQDWHPANHMSFAIHHPGKKVGDRITSAGEQQILWPVHCVQESKGAAFHPQLNKHYIQKVIYKGIDPTIDSYSAFFDNAHQRETGLADYLRSKEIDTVYVMGLATDYCVKYSCLDAIQLGFTVYLIEDGCRAVNLQAEDGQEAIIEMVKAGVNLCQSQDLNTHADNGIMPKFVDTTRR